MNDEQGKLPMSAAATPPLLLGTLQHLAPLKAIDLDALQPNREAHLSQLFFPFATQTLRLSTTAPLNTEYPVYIRLHRRLCFSATCPLFSPCCARACDGPIGLK